MKALAELVSKAHKLKSKGLSTYEIADELKVQPDTVVWLLLRGKESHEAVPLTYDIIVDWSPIGSSVKRISSVGEALADLIRESIGKGELKEPDVVAGIEGSGMVMGLVMAEKLGKPFAAVKPQSVAEKAPGTINPSYSSVENRKALIVDTVVRAGETHKAAVKTLLGMKAKPVGIAVIANKSGRDSVEGVPLKALIELFPVSKS